MLYKILVIAKYFVRILECLERNFKIFTVKLLAFWEMQTLTDHCI